MSPYGQERTFDQVAFVHIADDLSPSLIDALHELIDGFRSGITGWYRSLCCPPLQLEYPPTNEVLVEVGNVLTAQR